MQPLRSPLAPLQKRGTRIGFGISVSTQYLYYLPKFNEDFTKLQSIIKQYVIIRIVLYV